MNPWKVRGSVSLPLFLCLNYFMNDYLKYDDIKIFKYENLYLSIVYTIGHILIAMTCVRIITGASFDVAAIDAFIEPIINGFWFYFLLVYLKKIFVLKFTNTSKSFLSASQIGILLATIYTVGHIFIAMTCNRVLTGAPLNLAAIDALVEPLINGFWFFILFNIFNKFKTNKISNSVGKIQNFSQTSKVSKLAPINNKKHTE